ncbi:polysaccharide biosynthesis/export family protein [Candidatus Poribacteria bacterium]|nr:polysaccharide biosynthesis/export family protein [Candidatus Poribacteria bacterium]
MVKTIWAVACSAMGVVVILVTVSGCATAPKRSNVPTPPVDSTSAQGPRAAASSVPGPALAVDPAAPLVSTHASVAPPSSAKSISTPAPGPPGTHAAVSDSRYRIGAEDVLHISVWENKELTLDVVVRPDGKISVPLIQDVPAEGLTAAELADVIHQRLLGFVKEPQVSVIVTQVNAPKVFIVGNVTKPGPYPLRSDMSVLQALSLAGGFTQFASPRSIKLVRGAGNKQEVRKINYYKLLGDDGEGNYLLKPGDTIVVP